LVFASGAAMAQSAPLAGIPPAPVITVPAPTCEQPPTTAGHDPRPDEQKRWNKRIDEYKKCMVAYNKSLSDAINAYTADVNLMVDAAKKSLADYNTYAAAVRKDNDMDDDDDSSKK
jgi:hypothetical protein